MTGRMTMENTSRRPKTWRQKAAHLHRDIVAMWRRWGFYMTALVFFAAGFGWGAIFVALLLLWSMAGQEGW